MSKDHVIFGWGAPAMKEQFPQLSDADAEHFDKDNQAVFRLRLRGYLTDSQRDSAIKKMTREVARALQKATPRAETQEEKQGEQRAATGKPVNCMYEPCKGLTHGFCDCGKAA